MLDIDPHDPTVVGAGSTVLVIDPASSPGAPGALLPSPVLLAPPRPAAAISPPLAAFPTDAHAALSMSMLGAGSPTTTTSTTEGSSAGMHHRQHYHHHHHHHAITSKVRILAVSTASIRINKGQCAQNTHTIHPQDEALIPVATPAAAATAATPLPPPYVAVDLQDPSAAWPSPSKHHLRAPAPAAASAVGTAIVSPSKPAPAPLAPAAMGDLEAGETPFRLW